ncbi:hypothetical protein OH77DRAFT_332128 [Trametes cingulata]|nr:hypothetical protein OH77DRAFT_332128 [Trametes cingulata]
MGCYDGIFIGGSFGCSTPSIDEASQASQPTESRELLATHPARRQIPAGTHTVADDLESFTDVLLHTLLRRRKQDRELTREECALLRTLEDDHPDALAQKRQSLEFRLLAVERAEKNRLPGDCDQARERGLGPIATGLLSLVALHEDMSGEVNQGLRGTVASGTSGEEGQRYQSYLRVVRGLQEETSSAVTQSGDRGAGLTGSALIPTGALNGVGRQRRKSEPVPSRKATVCPAFLQEIHKENRPIGAETRQTAAEWR